MLNSPVSIFFLWHQRLKRGSLIERGAYLQLLLEKGGLIERGLIREGGLIELLRYTVLAQFGTVAKELRIGPPFTLVLWIRNVFDPAKGNIFDPAAKAD